MKFCTRTKNLNEDQEKQYAKDLKEFTKQEAEKFKDEKPQGGQEDEE